MYVESSSTCSIFYLMLEYVVGPEDIATLYPGWDWQDPASHFCMEILISHTLSIMLFYIFPYFTYIFSHAISNNYFHIVFHMVSHITIIFTSFFTGGFMCLVHYVSRIFLHGISHPML